MIHPFQLFQKNLSLPSNSVNQIEMRLLLRQNQSLKLRTRKNCSQLAIDRWNDSRNPRHGHFTLCSLFCASSQMASCPVYRLMWQCPTDQKVFCPFYFYIVGTPSYSTNKQMKVIQRHYNCKITVKCDIKICVTSVKD